MNKWRIAAAKEFLETERRKVFPNDTALKVVAGLLDHIEEIELNHLVYGAEDPDAESASVITAGIPEGWDTKFELACPRCDGCGKAPDEQGRVDHCPDCWNIVDP